MSSCMEEPLIKPPSKSPEPLVLRPPVGSEVQPDVLIRLRNFFHPPVNQRRMMCISLLCLLILSAVMAVFFLMIYKYSPWLDYHHQLRRNYHMCRVDFAPRGLRMTETFEQGPQYQDFFNVTVTATEDNPARPVSTSWIYHVCTESKSVIRNGPYCFVRPMDAKWQRMCRQFSPVKPQDQQSFRRSATGQLVDEQWFAHPVGSLLNLIRNPDILSLCFNTPSFELLSRPPTMDYVIDQGQTDDADFIGGFSQNSEDTNIFTEATPAPRPSLFEPEPQPGSFEDHVKSLIEREFAAPMISNRALFSRRRRSVHTAKANPGDPKRSKRLHCRHLTDLYEASPIPSEADEEPVTVTRDKLLLCPVE